MDKVGEWVVRYWPQRTRFYFWGFLRLCQFWWKLTKKCDRESAQRRTHWHADANRLYNPPHAEPIDLCYCYWTDNNEQCLMCEIKRLSALDRFKSLAQWVINIWYETRWLERNWHVKYPNSNQSINSFCKWFQRKDNLKLIIT